MKWIWFVIGSVIALAMWLPAYGTEFYVIKAFVRMWECVGV